MNGSIFKPRRPEQKPDSCTAILVVWHDPHNLLEPIKQIEITTSPPPNGIAIVGKGVPYQFFGVKSVSGAAAREKLRALLANVVVTE